ncbi:MAG: molybdopterin-dependent oxidoreductase [Lachnospiraceae bacterium]|jgi:CO/xanthine dehydrogenase Mo-binding subunit|nr:molybdopterin-dependent oxidoreductase [Lachnospiraceae bacterium]MCH4031741.1 molybdopterin-dependent oxidoreductase [Lachnospiraceae bacterium]MCH4071242.1 molybdopterin-dependent oxidoreductase [Lachnospiraceae bacterium]MCH4108295.1 molybdopterin-dependent oxidoreductase [Lachnospiraceae bacterium]MCI1302613.1 molybdopterin-dependent oxidoreductase [Lachnospiraceae bacterium]
MRKSDFDYQPYLNAASESSKRAKSKTDPLSTVDHSFRKKDWESIVTGQPMYTQDLLPQNCLVIKLLRSPHANAIIRSIDTTVAMKVPGMAAIFTWKDVPQDGKRFTEAGQTYPEASPYDRLILDRHVRFVGDIVAIVAGDSEKTVRKAMKLIKVDYEVLEPVLDFHQALDNPVVIHPEDNWEGRDWTNGDNKRNLVYHEDTSAGDVEAVLKDCDIVIDKTTHTKAVQQAHMEPFTTFCQLDPYGRLVITSSTQIVFHVRRNVARALGIPASRIRVIKPHIGGGFGAKQTAVSEVYPAFVTLKTGKPSMIAYTREECQTASSPRHEMEIHVRLGATKEGKIRAIDLYTLSNTGAYGEHGPTTVGLSGHKSIPLYRTESFRFRADVVYTNEMSAGAYRGYGAPQGIFAVETAVNDLAAKIGCDPIELRLRNTTKEGDPMPAYFNQTNTSSALDRCLLRVKKMSGWDDKFPLVKVDDHTVRTLGCAIAMQGSAITNIDVGSATLKLEEGGVYTLLIGAAEMGTGCETTLAQVAAEVLQCPLERISVYGADTDVSPYDSGSYASSTAYLTGKATEEAADDLRKIIIGIGAKLLGEKPEACDFDGDYVCAKSGKVSLFDIAADSVSSNNQQVVVTRTHSSPLSPPPYMAGVAEVETDLETGKAKVIHYYAAIDCGTPLNPAIARVQTEGGLLQAIGMALSENVTYDDKGRIAENSFLQYKIPARPDIGDIQVEFEPSYEESGPFGAKSIGEVVIDTPGPAVADAIYQATGTRFCELPITPEQIAKAAAKKIQ